MGDVVGEEVDSGSSSISIVLVKSREKFPASICISKVAFSRVDIGFVKPRAHTAFCNVVPSFGTVNERRFEVAASYVMI